MRKDAIDGFIAIWENATKVRYTAKGKRLFKETLQSAGYRLAGPGECVVAWSDFCVLMGYGWPGQISEVRDRLAREGCFEGRAMLSASQQKAPGSGASEGSKDG